MSAMTDFFRRHHLPPDLLKKTLAYMDALWSVNRGVDQITLLHELPMHLRDEILVAAHTYALASSMMMMMMTRAYAYNLDSRAVRNL